MSKSNLVIERAQPHHANRQIQEENRHDAPGTGSDKQHPDTPPPPFTTPKPDQQKPSNPPKNPGKKQ